MAGALSRERDESVRGGESTINREERGDNTEQSKEQGGGELPRYPPKIDGSALCDIKSVGGYKRYH
jgi:hypothetical protein